MKILFKHVDFNEQFIHNGITYTRANHNRGKVVGQRNKYKPFEKSTVVECDISYTLMNQIYRVV